VRDLSAYPTTSSSWCRLISRQKWRNNRHECRNRWVYTSLRHY
jgi:hypothetical protein